MKIIIIKRLYILTFFLPLFLISCEEENVTENVILSRLFRPVVLDAFINANAVTFNWTRIANAYYILELSQDSLLFTTNLKEYEVEGSDNIVVDDLLNATRYSARIKAVSKDGTSDDSGWQEITFLTGQENIFYAVPEDEIGINSVLLKWNNSKGEVTHIVVSGDGSDYSVTLSSEEIAAGEKLIDSLNAGTTYTFKIYNDSDLRGLINVTTKA